MKALVLGASGHLGNAIARELLHRGYEVTAISRALNPASNLKDLPVAYSVGDLDTRGKLHQWVSGHDVVVDAAAPYSISAFQDERGRTTLTYAAERTEAVLDAVHRSGSRMVFVSSFTTIVRRRSTAPSLGGAELERGLHPYFAAKESMEQRVVAAAKAGLPAVIVNPTMCLGPWECRDRQTCFVPLVACGEIPIGLRHILNIIDVRDVAEAAVSALEKKCYGKPMLFSGRNTSIESLFSWICDLAGARRPRFYAPAAASALASWFAEAVFEGFGIQMPASPALASALISAHDWLPPSTALRDLGVTLRPLSETLRDSVRWHRQLGYC